MKPARGLLVDFSLMLAVAVSTLVVYGVALDRIQLWGWTLAGTAVAAAVAHALAPAVRDADIGLLYVMGVNGQILMHYAALRGFAWDRYLEAMREGVRQHGPVRAGIYALADQRDP